MKCASEDIFIYVNIIKKTMPKENVSTAWEALSALHEIGYTPNSIDSMLYVTIKNSPSNTPLSQIKGYSWKSSFKTAIEFILWHTHEIKFYSEGDKITYTKHTTIWEIDQRLSVNDYFLLSIELWFPSEAEITTPLWEIPDEWKGLIKKYIDGVNKLIWEGY